MRRSLRDLARAEVRLTFGYDTAHAGEVLGRPWFGALGDGSVGAHGQQHRLRGSVRRGTDRHLILDAGTGLIGMGDGAGFARRGPWQFCCRTITGITCRDCPSSAPFFSAAGRSGSWGPRCGTPIPSGSIRC